LVTSPGSCVRPLAVQVIAAPGVHDFFDIDGAPAYVVSAGSACAPAALTDRP